jgi:RimJ/RimL family protein N-acetyltransferase
VKPQKDNQVQLRPAILKDKLKIYKWMAHSDITNSMFGPPIYTEIAVPCWEDFDNDYQDYYFDGSQIYRGRCFILLYNDLKAGQINYNAIDPISRSVEIDIWLARKEFTGKGLGPKAILLLCNYLRNQLKCKTVYTGPSARNKNAIKSYQKAGFSLCDKIPDNFVADYIDSLFMYKSLD